MKINKLTAIGIILLFVGVAIAPSFNASAIKTMFETHKNVPQTTLRSVGTKTDSMKHLLLFIFVYSIYLSRYLRAWILYEISWEDGGSWLPPVWTHPLLAIRSVWLTVTVMCWCMFWNYLSESNGWNWSPLHVFGQFPNHFGKRG